MIEKIPVQTKVYHYTKKTAAIEHILFEGKLKFGQFETVNDPRESKERSFRIVGGHNLTEEIKNQLRKEIHEITQKEWKVLSTCLNHPNLRNDPSDKPEVIDFFDKSSIYSNPYMSGSYRPRMWAQYAENHAGVCLKFDALKLNYQIHKQLGKSGRVFFGTVEYDDGLLYEPLLVDFDKTSKFADRIAGLREFIFDNYGMLFLRKSKDWETEYEFRWLIHNEQTAAEYISIED